MTDQEMERLVERITQAVRARLAMTSAGGQATNLVPTTRSCTGSFCGDHNGANCETCASRVDGLLQAGASRIGGATGSGALREELARTIDHTLLKPEATTDEVRKLCEEARQYRFASVCVNPGHVPLCRHLLTGSGVKTVAVVGFPLGATLPAAKAYEACEAVRQGADEIDMVINIGALKEGDYRLVLDDIRAVVEASRPAPVKVILETSKLDEEEKVAACTLSKAGGAAFVKTSTGFGGGGATAEDIALMRRVVGPTLGVKASGGVKTREQAEKMIAAGATRIGASASVEIVTGQKGSTKGY